MTLAREHPDHEPARHPRFVKAMRKHRFTAMTGVNTLFNALVNDPTSRNSISRRCA